MNDEIYRNHRSKVQECLEEISRIRLLIRLESKTPYEKISWRNIGNLNHVLNQLVEVKNFLSNEE